MRRQLLKSLVYLPYLSFFSSCKRASLRTYQAAGEGDQNDGALGPVDISNGSSDPDVRAAKGLRSSKLRGLRVFLDVGHCPAGGDGGALGHRVTEYELNAVAAQACVAYLMQRGVRQQDIGKTDDPSCKSYWGSGSSGENLGARGQAAQGYHVFVSIHHNASGQKSRRVQGSEVYLYARNSRAADISLGLQVKKELLQAVWKENGFNPDEYNRKGGNTNLRGDPEGELKTANFGVLRGVDALSPKVAKILTESFFVDDKWFSDPKSALYGREEELAAAGGLGIARGIESWWVESQSQSSGFLGLIGFSEADEGQEVLESPLDEAGMYRASLQGH